RRIMLFRGRAWIIEDFTTGNQRRGAQEACDGIGQRRFAAATFTREAKNFAPLQGEAYIGDGMYCAVGCQVIDIEMLHIQQSIGRNSCVSFCCHDATIFLASGTREGYPCHALSGLLPCMVGVPLAGTLGHWWGTPTIH